MWQGSPDPLKSVSVALFEGSPSSLTCPCKSSTEMKIGMVQWWNDTERENLGLFEKNLCSCHCDHRKYHADWPGIDSGPRGQGPHTNKLIP